MRLLAVLFLAVVLAGCGAPAPAADLSGPQRVELSFAAGAAVGGPTAVRVPLGRTVELVLRSDVDEQLHLHGYDRLVDVPAGGSASLTFVADIPGVFVAEAERAASPLARLEIG